MSLNGHSPEAKLQCKPASIDLGTICLGLPVMMTASIINEGKLCTAFRCTQLSPNTTCHPFAGTLEAHESVCAEISFSPDQVGATKTWMRFEQRGGPTVSMAITADVRVPTEVQFLEEELSFGTLYQGATKKLPLTVINHDCISCEIEIDLTEECFFTLSLGSDQWDVASGAESPLQQCSSNELDCECEPDTRLFSTLWVGL